MALTEQETDFVLDKMIAHGENLIIAIKAFQQYKQYTLDGGGPFATLPTAAHPDIDGTLLTAITALLAGIEADLDADSRAGWKAFDQFIGKPTLPR
jgi:hypothetical protein